ncbi:conserved hypothetical protein [Rubrivivax sp. A210]|uniref:DUF2249 domain-containing protein n=1 Tax=Rubrivivax sp. A210 TaxID=2772301 RepID=UPI00191AE9E0|nr:DUF2249 domain-containing protein [Rubrivivax sp. A210]CAD5374305.1 conserved hypothetical protein [Rubrivivax sp. A210]
MTRVIDGRGMEPPEPLQLCLQALEGLAEGEELVLLLFCRPQPLFDILGPRGYGWSERQLPDGTNEVRIRDSRGPHG